jgi:plastocyanin/uncharacterized membrane protein YozB (DUF420 family)
MNGFLGTGATFSADLNLVIQLVMGLALLLGMLLARRKHFTAHKYCQSSVLLLNLVLIILVMAPAFQRQVKPNLPANLGDAYYAVAAAHAVLGTIAEALGLYILLVAGTNWLPASWRFQRYKPWMRAELALWWLVVLLGLGTYYVWYLAPVPHTASQAGASTAQSATPPDQITIKLTNFAFEPPELTITAGTTVIWIDDLGKHTVEADDGSFKSETLTAGGRFEHKFTQPGRFPYHCDFHGAAGQGMAGVIIVTPPGGK